MSTFYLVRHGLKVSRDEDTLLSEAGVSQAELTGSYFKSKKIARVFVSPAKRTLQTAGIINNYLQVPQTTDSRLLERMMYEPSCGTFEAFLAEWDKTMVDRDYQPPYGDSSKSAGERVIRLLDEIHDDKNYLLVSHGGTIGDTVRNLFPSGFYTLTTDHLKKIQWLNISECSITEIQKNGDNLSLTRVSDTAHLE